MRRLSYWYRPAIARLGYPSLGSWVIYGLGTENQNLPGFIVLVSGGNQPDGGKQLWGSGFLPSVYQGVQCRSHGEPVLYLENPPDVSRPLRRRMLDAVDEIDRQSYAEFGNPETVTRIAQYEMAFRMQMDATDAMDIHKESAAGAGRLRRETRRSPALPTIAWWRAAWRSGACASFSSTTGDGTTTERQRKIR